MSSVDHAGSRAVCDGYDVNTEHGVLHFTYEPSEADVADVIKRLSQQPEPELIEAEDGVVV
jgi:hypothetical protein